MRNYQNMVFSTATRLVGNPAEAQDIAQEVFIRAYEHFDTLRDSASAGGWLKTVATNLSLNHLTRHRSRWRLFSEWLSPDASEEEGEALNLAADDCVEANILEQERAEYLDHLLQKLPESQRVPLVLFHLEGFSYQEIARRLGISMGKVKTDILRARQSLRRKLDQRTDVAREIL